MSFALPDDHWKLVIEVLQRKSAERRVTTPDEQIDLFREFWLLLADKQQAQTFVDNARAAEKADTIKKLRAQLDKLEGRDGV